MVNAEHALMRAVFCKPNLDASVIESLFYGDGEPSVGKLFFGKYLSAQGGFIHRINEFFKIIMRERQYGWRCIEEGCTDFVLNISYRNITDEKRVQLTREKIKNQGIE